MQTTVVECENKMKCYVPVYMPCRESLKACRQHLKSLHSQRADLQYRVAVLGGQIEADERGGEGRGSVASCGFLRGQLGRLNTEISREEEVEREIVDKLQVRRNIHQ